MVNVLSGVCRCFMSLPTGMVRDVSDVLVHICNVYCRRPLVLSRTAWLHLCIRAMFGTVSDKHGSKRAGWDSVRTPHLPSSLKDKMQNATWAFVHVCHVLRHLRCTWSSHASILQCMPD